MRFRLPDWSIYALVLAFILFNAMQSNNDIAPQITPPLGAPLPDIDPFGETVVVETAPLSSSSGTAFSIDDQGTWMTARHVVDGCDEIGILSGPGQGVRVERAAISERSDIAILRSKWARPPLATDLTSKRRFNEIGFFFGFPQGQPGDVVGSLIGRNQMVVRGRYNSDEAVFAWAETARSRGLNGSLGGLSGGPVFDSDGEVMGVVTAESPRRGRVYTVIPSNLIPAIGPQGDVPAPTPISAEDFGPQADRLRRDRRIAQVVCVVNKPLLKRLGGAKQRGF